MSETTVPVRSGKPAAPKQPRPLVLSADVLRIGPLTVLHIKSPGKRQGDVEATAYVVCRLNPAEGEAFRLFKQGPTGESTGDVYDLQILDGSVSCDCKGHVRH